LIVDTLVWTGFGLSLGLAVASFAAQHEVVWRGLSEARNFFERLRPFPHERCWFCGMSRAFVALWQGDLAAASALNPHAVYLFGAMLAGLALGPLHWGFRVAGKRFFNAKVEVAHE
jgi:hypothetical protein